jgi:very-short-patch-repair endonuclease
MRACRDWISKLIDLSRSNKLLYFRDLKTGTLDLSDFDATLMEKFLAGESVSLARLVPSADERVTLSRAQEIRRSALANLEEKGLQTLFVAFGFATWPATDDGRPAESPVVMVPVSLEKRGREARAISIKITGEFQINPILLYVLEKEHGHKLQPESLLALSDNHDEEAIIDPKIVCARLQQAMGALNGFKVVSRVVLGNFAFHKMAMVRDLQEHPDLLAAHDLISAIAGDPSAREVIRGAQQDADPNELDQIPPENEFLVLDTDSSQQAAIRAIVRGQNGVVIGPPGTGKSQTIANLIAELAARGRRTLFVAEKRVALEVVMERLRNVGLGHLALDLHGAAVTRKEVMRQFSESLNLIREALPVDGAVTHRQFLDRRSRLNQHVARIHSPRAPSDMSVFQIQGQLLRSRHAERSKTRWRGAELGRLSPSVVSEIRDLLVELGGFSGLLWRTDKSPWTGWQLVDGVVAQQALDSVSRLHGELWPTLRTSIAIVVAETGIPEPTTIDELKEVLDLVNDLNSTLGVFTAEIFQQDLNGLMNALAPSQHWRSRFFAWAFHPEYRQGCKTVAALCTASKRPAPQLYRDLSVAIAQVKRWTAIAPSGSVPAKSANVGRCRENFEAVQVEIERLTSLSGRADFARSRLDELEALITNLASDTDTPYRIPRFIEIERRIAELGASSIVKEILKLRPDSKTWSERFDYAWLASCLDQARMQDPALAGFNGPTHGAFVEEFCISDKQRLHIAAARTRRAHAEQVTQVMNAHPDQADLVRREANKKARHLPLRRLLSRAPEVLTALRPCWLVSPLSVSELIPAERRYFDIVLFDEASQVLPEDAVPALLRGSMTVVAGDQHQLPPTKFFTVDEEVEEGSDSLTVTSGFESMLDQLLAFLNPWFLEWHYRSRDEALIAFSNRHIYENRLVTFPGSGGPPSISHVLVPCQVGQDGQEESSSEEVRKVVDLILKHAAERPHESLGVIAMGLKHAKRVEAALDFARESRPEMDAFFDESKKERFFIKNLERVQGDERDATILTIGYGKDRSGRLLYRFGPLLRDGGERRLNVAITRARRRMILVSSFDHHDMDPNRSRARGVELLRLYIEYAVSHGQRLGDKGGLPFPPNSFETDVYEALTANGISLIPQYGASKYRIDLVAQHPRRPGRLVLAVECDGASYHSAYTARDRDRLRQQHLEALGFRFHRIWSTDWFMRREEEIARAIKAFKTAVTDADRLDTAGTGEREASRASNGKKTFTPEARQSRGLRGPRPEIEKKQGIDDYRVGELMAWLHWVESDGRLRTDDETIDEVVGVLFQRRGPRVERRLREALARMRS